MYCLPAASNAAAGNGRSERAIELYTLARRFKHITNSRCFEGVTGKELYGVEASLPPEVAKAAKARDEELDIWETAETLLLEVASN